MRAMEIAWDYRDASEMYSPGRVGDYFEGFSLPESAMEEALRARRRISRQIYRPMGITVVTGGFPPTLLETHDLRLRWVEARMKDHRRGILRW